MMTRRKIVLISISLITLLFLIGGFLYTSSDSFLNNVIKPRLQQALEDQIKEKYEVRIGKLGGNIFTGVEVEEFSLKEKETEKPPILSTQKVVLKYNFFVLLQRKLLVTALEINSPEINVTRSSDGQVDLTDVLRESSSDSESNNSFAFAVSNVEIKGGEIRLTDTQQKIELELPNIDVTLDGTLQNWDHTGSLSIGKGSFKLNGTEMPIERLDNIQFYMSTTEGDLERLQLKSGNSEIDIQEFNYNWDKEKWTSVVKLTIDAADVQKFLRDDTQLEGSCEVLLDLKGTNSTLNGKLTGTSDAFSIKKSLGSAIGKSESNTRQIDITNLNIDTTLELDEVARVTLNNFSAKVAGGSLTGNGSAKFDGTDDTTEGNLLARIQHFVKQPVTYESDLEVENIQLNSLLSMFGELPAESPQIESGTFTGTAKVKGNTSRNFHLDSSVKLSGTSLLVKGESIPLKDSSLNCKISSEHENGSNITADGTIDDTTVDINGSLESFDVTLKNVDFGKLLEIANTIPFKGIGDITAQIKKDGSATGHAEIPEAFYAHDKAKPIPLGSLTGDFRYVDKVVFFERTHLTKKDTYVSIEGNVKIEGKLPADFRVVAEPLVLDADYNNILFQQEYPIEGNMRGELKLSGSLINHLDGEGSFAVDSGKAWGINLDTVTLPFVIDDYSLTIPDFKITTRGQLVTFNAHIESNGELEFNLKNNKDKPVQLAELAIAADITDFPLDGKMDVNIDCHQKKSQDLVFLTDLTFSDLTFKGNPLGDATLHAILIEEKKELTSEHDYYKLTGKALANTCSIEGIVSNTKDNPYQITLTSDNTAATPILRILHPSLDVITGTFDGTVEVKGTIAELTSTDPVEPSKKRVYPYDVDISISKTLLQYNSLHMINPKQIRLKLEDDILTISDSSLSVKGEKSPFIQLTGTIDAKTEEIDISSKQNQDLTLESLSTALGLPISGSAQYEMKIKGTLSNPIVDLKWAIPTLVVNTKSGDVSIRDANGELTYQNDVVDIKPFTMQVLENPLAVKGNIAVDPDDFNNSKLKLELSTHNLNLAKFSDIIMNSMSVEVAKRLTVENSALIEGNIEVLLNVDGTIAEPVIDLNANTTDNYPIKFGAFAKPIGLEKLHAVTTVRKELVHIRDLVADGRVGSGNFHLKGGTSFSTQNKDEIKFDMGVSVEKLEVSDFITFFQQQQSPLSGTVSGTVNLAGTGFTEELITATCKIDELNLQAYNYQIANTLPIDFKLNNNNITTFFPLQITSPKIETSVDVSLDGPLVSPNISLKWQGILTDLLEKEVDLPLHWQGKAEYANKLFTLSTELANNGDTLTLKGTVPFDLSFTEIDFSERFLDVPIMVQLNGRELPLNFFPGFDNVFSEADGVTDIDLTLKGTTRTPYLDGNVYFHAPHLHLKKFYPPLKNVEVLLKASKDVIKLEKFHFDIEDGSCNLQQSELKLDGLTPKSFLIKGLSLDQYPLGSTLRQAITHENLENLSGIVTATLTELKIPFDSFFENGEGIPIPKLREVITFDRLSQKAEAVFTIDNISIGFNALDRQYNFVNPEQIPISLVSGTFQVKALKLQNTIPIAPTLTEDPLIFTCYGRWNMHGEIFASLRLENLNVLAIDPLLTDNLPEAYNLSGMLSTHINITGTYAAPEVTVVLDGDKLTINQANIDEFSFEMQYSSEDQRWTIPENSELLRIGNNRLICSGHVPYILSISDLRAESLSLPMALTFTLQMDELGVLHLIDPLIESSNGNGTINATVSGTPNAPQLKGTGEFNQVSLNLSGSPVSFDQLEASFDFTDTGLNIQLLQGQLNGGDFSATGKITSDWLTLDEIDIDTSLGTCNFVEPGSYQINLSSGDLHLHGTIEKPILTGDININLGSYEQNWETVRDWFSGSTISEVDRLTFNTPFLRRLKLDVGIEIPNNFHFLSSLGGPTDIEIDCSGQLTGTIQNPIFIGDVSLLKGRISIITQIFEIDERSIISNRDETAFNPVLDISLKTLNPIRGVLLRDGSTADLAVTATVTGTLENGDIDKAKLSFQAEPLNSSTTEVFTDAEILALLSPGNSISRSFGGILFTVSSGLDPNERHIIAEYPLPFNLSIKVEADEKGEFGVDFQLLERKF